jgi:hypothetical protein
MHVHVAHRAAALPLGQGNYVMVGVVLAVAPGVALVVASGVAYKNCTQ